MHNHFAKKLFLVSCALILFLSFSGVCFSQEVTILFSGASHSALYPKDPGDQDLGGLARRASKIKELRMANSELLLVDTGNFFAGGRMDPNSIGNQQLDVSRTTLYMRAMNMMGYDAAAVGASELQHGLEMLQAMSAQMQLVVLSYNIAADGFQSYVIKEVGKKRVGIIGVMPSFTTKNYSVIDPKEAVKNAIVKLIDEEKVDVIILLSQLSSELNDKLANELKEIDCIIGENVSTTEKKYKKIGSTILVKSPKDATILGKLNLQIKNDLADSANVEYMTLDSSIEDDPELGAIIPRCYSDNDCWRADMRGICQRPGGQTSSCAFEEIVKASLYVITPEKCRTCNTTPIINNITSVFPGLDVKHLKDSDSMSKKFMEYFSIEMLPAFILSKEIDKDPRFEQFSKVVYASGDYYYIQPSVSGVSYFASREVLPRTVDLFILLTGSNMTRSLKLAQEVGDYKDKNVKVNLNLVGVKNLETNQIISPGGVREINEDKLFVCVDKYYPKKAWDYLACRIENIDSPWWDDCLEQNKISVKEIKQCAKSDEANKLVEERIKLSEELQILSAPFFLFENIEIFGVTPQTTSQEIISLMSTGKK